LHISVYCCFVSGRCISLGVLLYYWLFSRTICSVVTCEGGETTLSCNPLPSQNLRSLGTSPLGLTTLKRKNHSIVVTLGGTGSCYASLTLQPLAFFLATNCAITRTRRGVQWDRCQIRVSQKGWDRGKKCLKVKGTIAIIMKRGMQWDRLQIRVLTSPKFFFTLAELYSELNNTAVTKWPNY
jgi:hypothetical protein